MSELSGQQLVAVSNSILLRSEVLAVLDTVNTYTYTVTSTVMVNIVRYRNISGAAGLVGCLGTCSTSSLGCCFLHIINIQNEW